MPLRCIVDLPAIMSGYFFRIWRYIFGSLLQFTSVELLFILLGLVVRSTSAVFIITILIWCGGNGGALTPSSLWLLCLGNGSTWGRLSGASFWCATSECCPRPTSPPSRQTPLYLPF